MSGELPWFRLYNRMVDDEKLRLLAFEDRWHFVALCCLKSSGLLDEPDSDIRSRKIAVKLGVQVRELEEIGRRLEEVGLVDKKFNPLAWQQLQQRSDGSAERVRRYRNARKAAGLQAQWQPSKTLRKSIYDRDGNCCVYCNSGDDLTLDHRIPEKRGGDHSPENLQTACRACNAQKRDLTHDEYVIRREESNGNQRIKGSVTTGNGYSNGIDRERDLELLEPKGSCASGDALKPEHVVERWNEIAPALGKPKVRILTPERRQRVKARIGGFTLDEFREVIGNIQSSPFLRGDTGWQGMSFDWFTKKTNFVKILEGNYNG